MQHPLPARPALHPAVVTAWLALILCLLPTVGSAEPSGFEVDWPERRLWVGAEEVEGIRIRAIDGGGGTDKAASGPVSVDGLSTTASVVLVNGHAELSATRIDRDSVTISGLGSTSEVSVRTLAGGWTLVPALLAIILALVTRQVLVSLFGGVLLGAALLHQSFLLALPRSVDMVINVAADPDKLKIIVFTLFMGGLVGIISKNGGTLGMVQAIAKRATTVRSGSIATWGMGMLVFFDDYASSLLIGTTMRPLTDKLRISREKLSYMVDSTAAPISSLAIVSTWIGYEVTVLGDAMKAAGIDRDPYEVFVSGLSSRFYPIFALLFVFIVAWTGRDFGPMLKAERRARLTGKLIRDGGEPLMDDALVEEANEMKAAIPRWWLAAIPLLVLVGTVLGVLLFTGLAAAAKDPTGYAEARAASFVRSLGYLLSNADSYNALVYAGAASCGVAGLLSFQAMSLKEIIDAIINGVRSMTLAVIVLCLAWSIGDVMNNLHAGGFVASMIGDQVPAWALAAVTFVLAGLMAFATGTAWGTMAILFPITIPIVALHTGHANFDAYLLGTSSAILAGAVFGDHCSPISDTTILSSVASCSDHVDHTRTQAPYALLCGSVAIAIGYIPFGLGVPAWVCVIAGVAVLVGFLLTVGRRAESSTE